MFPKKISELAPIVKLEPVPLIVAAVPPLKAKTLAAPVILIEPVVSIFKLVLLPTVKVSFKLQQVTAAGVSQVAHAPLP